MRSSLSVGLERKTGFEPAALALARRCSTPELLPRTIAGNLLHADLPLIRPASYGERTWSSQPGSNW
ncbi:protein of unknown function [Kyrpidia spormannii]|uniref:Uncharacterized protein n=2 Tax=Kyrpidia spormannii TaxID=2055160 RepID=A0ACA8Z9P7_9BACL|nr:protein of unknown function [Kyrpidia spormannii]CAB3392869.1 protein of unknown function [Kyrpidia spormannii]